MSFIIDKEFAALIPPLTDDERQQLETNLRADGCRDPLVVWKPLAALSCCVCGDEWGETVPPDLCHCPKCDHHYPKSDGECGNCHTSFRGHKSDMIALDTTPVLLDGHNRYRICQKHSIAFTVRQIPLLYRADAKIWIIRNQFARRNLTPYQRAELALVLEPLVAAKAKERQAAGGKAKVLQNSGEPPVRTDKELAAVAGVSHDTLAKAKFLRDRATPKTKEELRTAEISINKAYTDIKRADKETQRESRRKDNQLLINQSTDIFAAGARFATLVIDPPWDWGDEGDKDQLGRAKPTYDENKRCDYILWFWQSSRRWCLVPFPMLCAVFHENLIAWDNYKHAKQRTLYKEGGSYHSECIFVPRKIVWRAIYLKYAGQPPPAAMQTKEFDFSQRAP